MNDVIKRKHDKFDVFTKEFHIDIVYYNLSALLNSETQEDVDEKVLNIVVLLCYDHFSECFNAKRG